MITNIPQITTPFTQAALKNWPLSFLLHIYIIIDVLCQLFIGSYLLMDLKTRINDPRSTVKRSGSYWDWLFEINSWTLGPIGVLVLVLHYSEVISRVARQWYQGSMVEWDKSLPPCARFTCFLNISPHFRLASTASCHQLHPSSPYAPPSPTRITCVDSTVQRRLASSFCL